MSKKGYKQTKQHKEKIRKALKGRVFSKEWRKKISVAQRGKKISKETREKISKANTGRKQPSSEKRKRAKSLLGNKNGFKKGCTPWNKGKKMKDYRDPKSVLLKMSTASLGRKHSVKTNACGVESGADDSTQTTLNHLRAIRNYDSN